MAVDTSRALAELMAGYKQWAQEHERTPLQRLGSVGSVEDLLLAARQPQMSQTGGMASPEMPDAGPMSFAGDEVEVDASGGVAAPRATGLADSLRALSSLKVNDQAGNARAGRGYAERNINGRNYHEYFDPKTGERELIFVKPRRPSWLDTGMPAA